MATDQEMTPDALVKRLFTLTILGVAAYITAVILLNATGDPPPTDAVRPAVAIFAQAR
jgi:hypothetical protein